MGRKSQNHLLAGQHNGCELLYSVLVDLNALSFSAGGKRCAVLVGKGRENQRSLTLLAHRPRKDVLVKRLLCSTALQT